MKKLLIVFIILPFISIAQIRDCTIKSFATYHYDWCRGDINVYETNTNTTKFKIYKDYFNAYAIASSFAQSYLDEKDKHADIVHRLLISNNVLRDNIYSKKEEIEDIKVEMFKLKKEIKELKQTNKELRYNYV